MTGLCRADRDLRGVVVAHFTDQDYVRVFAQRRAQSRRKGWRIRTDFALVDHTLVVPVQKLDGVL
ncbi:MAG: hypothetical protein DDT20_01688 [Firmicutes bacterium]|nr:hypothetical protein [Bacillota bacterium]